MALGRRSALDSIGVGKKHDLPVQQHSAAYRPVWSGVRRRRVILVIAALFAIYLFVKHIPTDVPPVGQRYDQHGPMAPGRVQPNYGAGRKNNEDTLKSPKEQNYEGSLRFERLSASLRSHITWNSDNNNVLFAFPEMSTTSNLLPLACQMAQNNRSIVHLALLGRHTVDIRTILKVNGIVDRDCPVNWHDATPDHAMKSSQERIEASIRAGLGHCSAALRPQLILVDDNVVKTRGMSELLHEAARYAGVQLVSLPSDASQSLPWIAMLESSSIRVLKEVEIDIVIQAYPESAGPLLRLLHSIRSANYHGWSHPKVTIELPTIIDPFVSSFLENFQWPPGSASTRNAVTLRRRVETGHLDPSEASLRTVEIFYPRTTAKSHVLLLSSDAELSPSYFHYLIFLLLEYKYAQINVERSQNLFGLSLSLPEKRLDDQEPFLKRPPSKEQPFVLSQSPNRNAALVVGEKWVDLQNFVSQRLVHDRKLEQMSASAKTISKEHPRWLGEALDYMQAQNLYMLYPAFAKNNDLSLVTFHQELHRKPEEYSQVTGKGGAMAVDTDQIMRNDVLTDIPRISLHEDRANTRPYLLPLDKMLVVGSKRSPRHLPHLNDVPVFAYNGDSTGWSESELVAAKFRDSFSLAQGDCDSLEARDNEKQGTVEYLFCNKG